MTVFKLIADLLGWCWGEGGGARLVWVGFFSYPVDVPYQSEHRFCWRKIVLRKLGSLNQEKKFQDLRYWEKQRREEKLRTKTFLCLSHFVLAAAELAE